MLVNGINDNTLLEEILAYGICIFSLLNRENVNRGVGLVYNLKSGNGE